MKPLVIDNFLPERIWNQINYEMNNTYTFPWYYVGNTVGGKGDSEYNNEFANRFANDPNVLDLPIFTHTFYKSSDQSSSGWLPLVTSITQQAESVLGVSCSNIRRIKSNLTLPLYPNSECYSIPHTDHLKDTSISVLYYVNDSDGDTIMFDKTYEDTLHPLGDLTITKRVTPKANRAVIFNSNILHSSSSGQTSDKRIIINTILEMENKI
jgi:Rps23 Pro-64 3,4-dihydroxylase Tpa1-like proline 4-hydroxylase